MDTARRSFVWIFTPALILCSLLSLPVASADQSNVGRNIAGYLNAKVGPPSQSDKKIAPRIFSIIEKFKIHGITRKNARERRASSFSTHFVRVDEDANIQVYIYIDSGTGNAMNILRDQEVRIEIANRKLGIIQGWIPADRVEELAQFPDINKIVMPKYATSHSGSVVTEGDSILKADLVRAQGYLGAGVKVAVISDGANDRHLAQATGDLPSVITAVGVCVKRTEDITQCSSGWSCNEGTAIMEIIHDIAPDAELAIGSAGTSLEFIQRVEYFANIWDADIIIDDLGFYGEPYFQDGEIAQAVAAVSSDILYVSSAGNSGWGHYEKNFQPILEEGLWLHDFGTAGGAATDNLLDLVIPPNSYSVVVLQWNDQYGNSANDYDLYALNSQNEVINGSAMDQNGYQDPIEAMCLYNSSISSQQSNFIAVNRFSGSTKTLEIFFLGGWPEYNMPEGSIFGHAAVPEVLAVGAISASDPGNDTIEGFSSRGPSRIDFPFYQLRQKPDLAGIDGVSVTGTGGFVTTFYGTSASAPHVAAIAALLKSAAPNSTVNELTTALKNGAVDLGTAGDDTVYGSGRVDAVASLDYLVSILDARRRSTISIINSILMEEE